MNEKLKDNIEYNEDIIELDPIISDEPVYVRALPIHKRAKRKVINDLATSYLDGEHIQGLEFDPNSKYAKTWAHNLKLFNKAVVENQEYSVSPHTQYTSLELHDLARHFNSFNLNTSKINFGNINPKKMVEEYVKKYPKTSEEEQQWLLNEYERLKTNEQKNKRTFKTVRRYAGSDRQSIADRQFYKDLGLGMAGIIASPALAYVGAAPIALGTKLAMTPIGQGMLAAYSAYNLAGPDGVRKTIDLFEQGETKDALKSLGGDLLNLAGFVGPIRGLTKSGDALLKTYNGIQYGQKLYKGLNYSDDLLRQAKAINFGKSAAVWGTTAAIADNTINHLSDGKYTGYVDASIKNLSVGDGKTLYDQIKGTGWEGPTYFLGEMLHPVNFAESIAFGLKKNIPGFTHSFNFNKYGQQYDDLGRLYSPNLIDNFIPYQKLGIKFVHGIDPEDIRSRFEESPKLNTIIDDLHHAKWERTNDHFTLNGEKVDFDKVQVLDDVSMTVNEFNNFIQNLKTLDSEGAILIGKNSDLHQGGAYEPMRKPFIYDPVLKPIKNYTDDMLSYFDSAVYLGSKNKDITSYSPELKLLRDRISSGISPGSYYPIHLNSSDRTSMTIKGDGTLSINLPTATYTNSHIVFSPQRFGYWDRVAPQTLYLDNVDPKHVKTIFNDYPFRTKIRDNYHGISYIKNQDGSIVTDLGSAFDPNRIHVIPHFKIDPDGLTRLKAYMNAVASPEGNDLFLMGNVTSKMPATTSQWFNPLLLEVDPLFKTRQVRKVYDIINSQDDNVRELFLPKWEEIKSKLINRNFVGDFSHDEFPGGRFPITLKTNKGEFVIEDRKLRFARPDLLDESFTFDGTTYFQGMEKSGPLTRYKNSFVFDHKYNDVFGGGHISDLNISRNSARTINDPSNPNLVDVDGNINISAYNNLKKNIAQLLGKSEDEINKLFASVVSRTDGATSLDEHLMRVARSAQELPLPEGYSRQEAVAAAFLHDIGKIINADPKTHQISSFDLLGQLNIPELNNPTILNAIKYHMSSPELNLFNMDGKKMFNGDVIDTNIAAFVHLADVARGMSLNDMKFYYPHLFAYDFKKGTVLKGDPIEQMKQLSKITSDIGYGEIDTTLPIEQQWNQLQQILMRANKVIRGSRVYFDPNDPVSFHVSNYQNGVNLAQKRGLDITDPKNIWLVAQEHIPPAPTGSGRLNLFNTQTGQHRIQPNTWSDGAMISPDDMDGTYFSVSPETGETYMQASNSNSYGNQSVVLLKDLSDYEFRSGESPFEYFERLYPFIHRVGSIENYGTPINPLSEYNHQIANTLLGRKIFNMSEAEARSILQQHFKDVNFDNILSNGNVKIWDILHTINTIPQTIIDLYERNGFTKLDAILNNMYKSTYGASVSDLPHYRNNIVLHTAGDLPPIGSKANGQNFQGMVVGPKGKKIGTVLDEINADDYGRSSSKTHRDAGGDNQREGLKIMIPGYNIGGKLNK